MNISPSGLPAGNYTHATNVTDSEHLKNATTTHYTHADSLLVTQRVPGSPLAPRSTIPACSWELTQHREPWHRENALGPVRSAHG